METLNITRPMVGDTITTARSRERVTVADVVEHTTKDGLTVYRCQVVGATGARWTSVKYLTDDGLTLTAY